MFASNSIASVLFALAPAILAAPLEARSSTFHSTEVIFQDFADPSLLQVGTEWFAFATNNHKTLGNSSAVGSESLINVQIATSPDFHTWTVTGQDALPTPGAWVDTAASGNAGGEIWAPKVILNDEGVYVMHYSGAVLGDNSKHCVGVATSLTPEGPYTAHAEPFACPLSAGGAVDSTAYKDTDGTFWVLYKVDGNSIGHGGTCDNTVAPIVPTPIMLQQVAVDGYTPVGDAIQVLDRSALDGPLIEAPSLMKDPKGFYYLFFSSNCFATDLYDLSYAFATNIEGPYTKAGPFEKTTSVYYSPGGGDVDADNVHMVFHAGDVGPYNEGWRSMYAMTITVVDSGRYVTSTAV